MKYNIKIGNPSYGWTYLKIDNFINISCSGVFNPFPDIVNFLGKLKQNQKFTLLIDQEGYDAEIKILKYHNNNVLISFCTFKDRNPNFNKPKNKYKYFKEIRKTFKWINKNQFLKDFTQVLKQYYILNNKVIHDEIYPLDFKLRNLNRKNYIKLKYLKNEFKYNNYRNI